MPDRLYFLLGDLLSNIVVGALAALVSALLVNPTWNMFVAMLLCMILGMLIAVVSGTFVFMRYFGAMEVMVPIMLGGMIAGMVVGMRAAMLPVGVWEAAKLGAGIGLIALLFCAYANYLIRGDQRRGSAA